MGLPGEQEVEAQGTTALKVGQDSGSLRRGNENGKKEHPPGDPSPKSAPPPAPLSLPSPISPLDSCRAIRLGLRSALAKASPPL